MDQHHKKTFTDTPSEGGNNMQSEYVAGASASPSTEVQDGATPANEEVREVYATAEQLRSVFSNALITDIILSSFNFMDLKAAREVSRDFCEMIESFKRFKETAILHVTEQTLNHADILFNVGGAWSGIKVDVSLPREVLQSIPRHILQNVQFVSLVSNWWEPVELCIREVLERTPKISHLQLNTRLLERNLETLFTPFSPVRKNLQDIKRLDILSVKKVTGNGNSICCLNTNYSTFSRHEVFRENFLHLANTLRRLESFRLHRIKFLGDKRSYLESVVVELLQNNRETLRELSLHLEIWENDNIRAVTFPLLNCLTLSSSLSLSFDGRMEETVQERLKDFFANHPSLIELDVAFKWDLRKDVFDVIARQSANLKKFHLKVCQFVDNDDNEGEAASVDWSFLGGMTRLTDFKLSRPRPPWYRSYPENWEAYGNGTRILASLPRNQLDRLSLRGIGLENTGFWKLNVLEDDEPELGFKLELLRGFRNLKSLSLRHCLNAVDNDIMQFFIREMKYLEELELSHSFDLTDAGIVGTSRDGSDSIRNLKELKTLSILHCYGVTPAGLLSCLRLPSLRHFSYFGEDRLSKSFALQIISQNPSLESLALRLDINDNVEWLDIADSEVLEEAKNNNHSRLTKFTHLNDDRYRRGTGGYEDSENSD